MHSKCVGDQLESGVVLEGLDLGFKLSELHLLPRRRGVVVLPDEVSGKCIELGLSGSTRPVVLSKELADVQEGHDQEVKSFEAGFFDGKPSVTIGGIPALHLNSHLGKLVLGWSMPGIGVDTDQVVALVVRRSLVGKDVPPHEVAHDEEFRSCGDNRKSKEFFCCHEFVDDREFRGNTVAETLISEGMIVCILPNFGIKPISTAHSESTARTAAPPSSALFHHEPAFPTPC